MDAEGDAKLAREFEVLAERAGLAIPPEYRAAVFEQFRDLRRMIALLHQPRDATAEPASTYSVESVTRSLENGDR